MNTVTRKTRERAEREQHLLDVANNLVREKGLITLQMSHLAQAAEVAMGTLYSHFSSKEDLLLALAVRISEQQGDYVVRAARWQAGTRDRMMATALADWLFLHRNPHFAQITQYALSEVAWERASEARRQDFVLSREPVGAAIFSIVRDAQDAGDLPRSGFTVEELPFGFWTMVVGTQQLTHTRGLLEHFSIREPHLTMVRHIVVWLNGLSWKPLASANATDGICGLRDRLFADVFPEEPCA
ncbi:MAG: TetR/AcrR family transcriptional regulator [Oceanococcaceae bacterium]